jgi:hypothetical protein
MKNIITFLCIALFTTSTFFAQKNKESKEKIKALKIAFLTEKLSLTSNEAQKFWPIYNAHENNSNIYIREKQSKIKKEIFKAGGIDAIDDNRAKELFNEMVSLEKKRFDENEKYVSSLKKVLPIKKIIKLYISEREFGRQLMRKYRKKRSESKN